MQDISIMFPLSLFNIDMTVQGIQWIFRDNCVNDLNVRDNPKPFPGVHKIIEELRGCQ